MPVEDEVGEAWSIENQIEHRNSIERISSALSRLLKSVYKTSDYLVISFAAEVRETLM